MSESETRGARELLRIRLIATLGTFLISFSALFVRLADVSPSTAAIFRTLYALPLLLIGWIWLRSRDRRTSRSRLLGAAAGLSLAIDFACWHRSIDYIGSGLATVLGNTQVFFVAIGAWLILGEKPRWTSLAALPVAFTGVFLIAGIGGEESFGTNPLWGALFGLLTGLTYAAYLMLFRRSSQEGEAPSMVVLAEVTLVAAAGSLLIAPTDAAVSLMPHFPAHYWLILLALNSQVLGWLMIAYALPRLPSLETSVLLLMQPLLAVIWGWALLDETLGPLQWVGAALVVFGIALINIPVAVQERAPLVES